MGLAEGACANACSHFTCCNDPGTRSHGVGVAELARFYPVSLRCDVGKESVNVIRQHFRGADERTGVGAIPLL